MGSFWNRIGLGAFLVIAAFSMSSAGLAAESDQDRAQTLPAKALILGVPYVSWHEAAQWRYEDKDILNPSRIASLKMIRHYWGQDSFRLFRFGSEDYIPEHWKKGKEPAKPEGFGNAKGLNDLKSWIARGVPVYVPLPFTPHAHPLTPQIAAMFVLGKNKGPKLPEPGPSSKLMGSWASWQHLLELGGTHSDRHVLINESATLAERVVIGYDDERRVMILHDPSFGPAWEMGYDDFESNWRIIDMPLMAFPPDGYAEFVAKRQAAAPYPLRTPDMQAAVHYAYGYGFSQVGRTAEAERELEHGLAIPGVGNGYRHLLAFELAHHRRAAGRIEDAIALLRQAIEALPEHPEPHRLLTAIIKDNPSLPAARQAFTDMSRWGSLFETQKWLSPALRALPSDFMLLGPSRFRRWACEPDFRGSRC